ncbi:MAG: MFS transporter [Tissierellia bacterium]|nr:MFS transporter [Tissierellia bacterium]
MTKNQGKSFATYRFIVFSILIIAYMVVFFHRLAVGAVRDDLMRDFNMSNTTFANLSSTYFYAYTLMQIPSGILADYIGARLTVTFGTLLAGIGSIVFGFANSIFMIFFGRLLVGIGVSVIFIAILKVQSKWFKENEFGTISGLTGFFGNLGGVLAQTPLALLTAAISWRYSFGIIGLFSIVIAVLCYILVRNEPSHLGFPNLQEDVSGKKISLIKGLKTVILNPRTWPSFFVFAGLFGAFGALTGTWGVSYLTSVYGVSKVSATNYMTVAVIGMSIGSAVIGKFSDKIRKRKLPMLLFGTVNLVSWALLIFLNGGKPPIEILNPLLFILGISCPAFALGWACSKEVNPPEITGISTSVVNIGGFLGGAIMPPVVGYIIDKYGEILSPVQLYQRAFLYCFIAVVIGYIAIFLVKETNCRNIYKEKQ